MRISRTFRTLAAIAGGVALAAGLGAGPRAEDTIKVGHYASMTGSEATFGLSTDRGIRLAVKEINDAGGVNGKKIEVITYDDKGEAKEAGNAVLRLVTSDKVAAVLGEVASGLSMAGGQVCQERGVPMITPSSTNPGVTRKGDFIFRVCFLDTFQGYAVAKFARDDLKAGKVAVLYAQSAPYSKGLRDEFKKNFEKLGGKIVADQAYTQGDQDFTAQLNSIRAAAPDAIFVPGYYTDVGNIVIQARKIGIAVPLLGGDGWDSEQLAKIGGSALNGCCYSNHYAPDQPTAEVKAFVEKYQKAYNGETPDGLAALGYDAAKVLAAAMQRCKSLDGKTLRDEIAKTRDHKGVTGTITLDKNRDAEKVAVMLEFKDGKWGYRATIEPQKSK